MLRTKPDVRFEVITPALIRMLTVLERLSHDVPQDLIITSGSDGAHMEGSFHYKGRAIDLRSKNLSPAQRELIAYELRYTLGKDYDVVIENNPPHIHIEYDPK